MTRVAIVSAYRSAIGSFGGSLKDVNIPQVCGTVVASALEKISIDNKLISEVIFGNVLHAGLGQNIARQVAIHANIPKEVPAFTVNKVCGSGLKSITLAANSILSGENSIVVCGGLEFMSQAPYLSKTNRFGSKLGNAEFIDSIINDGLTDAFNNYHMGITAENIAERYNITREEADAFALESQRKAATAQQNEKFKDEIIPISVKIGRNEIIFAEDEYVRTDSSLEKLEKLRPAFKKDGISTAGNSSGINDGVAVLVLMSEEKAMELDIKPLAFIEGYASCGLAPETMGLGPINATQKLLKQKKIDISDIDLFEFNEAFATQSIAVIRDLKVDPKKVNVNGGAIALGHPIGASGSRILVTLVHELTRQNKKYGLCSLCIGGGQGIAMLISNNKN